MTIRQFDSWLRQNLDLSRFTSADNSLNGLQVGQIDAELSRLACGVDASLETIQRAAAQGAQLLFVHHGLFWGRPAAITGSLYQRIQALFGAGMGLYACHLPLDAHPELGNNAVLAGMLGLEDRQPFGEYHGLDIGFKGRLPRPMSLEAVCSLVLPDGSQPLAKLPFGKDSISSVGLISGGGAFDIDQAIAQELDIYITGEISHSVYHTALEAGINMLSIGHYASEVHGVKAIAAKAGLDLGLESFFVDVPTGL